MEYIVVHTLCAAGMALLGAWIARGFPHAEQQTSCAKQVQDDPREDAFAKDLAAMLGYSADEEKVQDET